MNVRDQKKQSGEKARWRDHFKDLLQKDSPHSSVQIHQRICENLTTYLKDKEGIWAGYLPLLQEPDLSPVFHESDHIQWAFPRMEAHHLTFYISKNFIKGPFWRDGALRRLSEIASE